MTEDAKPAPDAATWVHIRMRYEQAVETVAQIAETIGLTPHALTKHAKINGWVMRGAAKQKQKSESTRETLKRLKEILQKRLSKLEKELDDISEDVSALSNERDIRATNTLVRTLEKVLELEHKDLKQRSQRNRDNRRLDAAEREDLAQRIARLQTEPEEICKDAGTTASDGDAAGLALLGEG